MRNCAVLYGIKQYVAQVIFSKLQIVDAVESVKPEMSADENYDV